MNKDQLGNKPQAQHDIEVVWKGLKIIWHNFWTRLFKWRKDNDVPKWIFWIFMPLITLVVITFMAILAFPLTPILTLVVRILQISDIMNRWEKNPPEKEEISKKDNNPAQS